MSQFQQLERNHYFTGRRLSADDFQREQNYTLARLRRRNRFLTGWGVVSGLGVSIDPSPAVVVQPGFAIDCAGNELIVEAETRLPLAGLSGRQHVVVRYVELAEGPVASPTGSPEFLRVRESSRIELSPSNPALGHRKMGCGTPGCGLDHAVGIAVLTQKGSLWRIASTLRPIGRPARRKA